MKRPKCISRRPSRRCVTLVVAGRYKRIAVPWRNAVQSRAIILRRINVANGRLSLETRSIRPIAIRIPSQRPHGSRMHINKCSRAGTLGNVTVRSSHQEHGCERVRPAALCLPSLLAIHCPVTRRTSRGKSDLARRVRSCELHHQRSINPTTFSYDVDLLPSIPGILLQSGCTVRARNSDIGRRINLASNNVESCCDAFFRA
jgi:hypothetical protein